MAYRRAPLLAALGAVLDPAGTDEMTYLSLLRSPIADADPSEIRRLGRVMRRQWREQTSEQAPPRSDALVASLMHRAEAVNRLFHRVSLTIYACWLVAFVSGAISGMMRLRH